MKYLTHLLLLAFLTVAPATAQEKSDDLAYQAFQAGQEAYARGDYQDAVLQFEQACKQALIFTGAYYIWLGTACEQAYDVADPMPNRLPILQKGVEAYRIAFDREHDPDIRYELGRLMVKHALAHATMVLDREVAGQPLPLRSLPGELHDTTRVVRKVGFRASTIDSVNHLWQTAGNGLHEIWEAILGRERKERIYTLLPQSGMSDTLQAYLSVYIENSLNLVESAGRVNFQGLEPDFYIPKISAACDRGLKGANPEWFDQVVSAIHFDGGYNMRCAIYRVKGLRLSKDAYTDRAIDALQNALIYARSDTSKASLYLDMAFTAYRTDLLQAVDYAKRAYDYNSYEPRVRDTYGGLALSLSSTQLKEGAYRKAISAIHPVTTFGWQDRGEALITLAIAYVNSDLKGVSSRAYEAAEKAYRIDPKRYWKEFHRIAKMQGNYMQALDLEKKHSNGQSNGQSNGH